MPTQFPTPTIVQLGDSALLVRFGDSLSDTANRAAIALSQSLEAEPMAGVAEIAPNLVSVLLRYDPLTASPAAIAGELRLRLFALEATPFEGAAVRIWQIAVTYDGPDLAEVATALGLSQDEFIAQHDASSLRVLATGFAPGFVYCGLHPPVLHLPRRAKVRPSVPVGSVLFAAGQTAITATEMPTGWHHVGRTSFTNFDPQTQPPTRLAAGDVVQFTAAP